MAATIEPAAIRRRHNYVAAVLSEWAGPLFGSMAHIRCGAPTPPAEWRRLAIFGSSHIGDVLYRTPSLDALRQGLPDCHITYICEPQAAELLETNPAVDAVLPIMGPGWRRSRRTQAALREARFDAALSTDHIAYHADLLLTVSLGIPNRTAFAHKGMSALATRRVPAHYPRPFAAYMRAMVADLIDAEPTWPLTPRLALTPADARDADEAWDALGLTDDRPVIACTLTNRQPLTRTWPVASFLRALAMVAERTAGQIVLCGGPADAERLRAAAAESPVPCHILAGRLRLRAFGAFLQRTALLLATDSGPRHIGNAVGTPVVFVRSLNVSRVENGAYCDTETDVSPEDEWLSPVAQDAALARLSPARVAEACLEVLARD
jgi:heptosyltransferase II